MPALATLVVEETRLGTLKNKKLFAVPAVLIFLTEKPGESLLTSPLDGNPFRVLLAHAEALFLELMRNFAIYIVLYRLNRCVLQVDFLHWRRCLKPVRDLKYVALLQILVIFVALIFLEVNRGRRAYFSELPLKDILLR